MRLTKPLGHGVTLQVGLVSAHLGSLQLELAASYSRRTPTPPVSATTTHHHFLQPPHHHQNVGPRGPDCQHSSASIHLPLLFVCLCCLSASATCPRSPRRLSPSDPFNVSTSAAHSLAHLVRNVLFLLSHRYSSALGPQFSPCWCNIRKHMDCGGLLDGEFPK